MASILGGVAHLAPLGPNLTHQAVQVALLEGAALADAPVQGEDLVQALLDAKQSQRFDDVILHPLIEGLLDGLHVAGGGHHDDVGFAVVAAQPVHPPGLSRQAGEMSTSSSCGWAARIMDRPGSSFRPDPAGKIRG